MRNWMKLGRRRVGGLLAIGVLGLLAWGVGPNVFLAQEKAENLPPELALVPPNAFAFVQVRPAELWNSSLGAKLRKQVAEDALPPKVNLFQVLDYAELESITMVAPSAAALAMLMSPPAKKTSGPTFKDKVDSPFKDKKFEEPFKDKKFEESFKDKKAEVPFKDKKSDVPVKEKKFEETPKDKAPDKKDDKEASKDKSAETRPGKTEGSQAFEKDIFEPTVLFIFTTIKGYDQEKVKKLLLAPGATEEKHKDKSYFTSPGKEALWFMNDKTYVVATSVSLLKQAMDRPEQARAQGPLATALDLAAKKHHLVIGLNLMDPLFQQGVKSALAEMNQPWHRDPVWTLLPLAQTRTASLAADVSKENGIQAQASLTFSDPERADEAIGAVQDGLALGRIFTLGRMIHEMRSHAEDGDFEGYFYMLLFKQAEAALRKTTVERRLATIQLQAQGQFDIDAVRAQAKTGIATVAKGEGAVPKRFLIQSLNNMKQLVLTFHIHNDVYRSLPPAAICSKEGGKPLLSWRVAILPYLEEDALFRQFKLDEPWDSAHNITLLPKMPKVFAPAGIKTKEPYTTFYQAFAGKNTALDIRLDPKAMLGALGTAIPRDFTDGTSNTLAIVEAGEPVPWTKPADIPYDEQQPLPKLGGMFNGAFHAGRMDGSVGFFKGVAKEGTSPLDARQMQMITEETLRTAITRNNGKVRGPDW